MSVRIASPRNNGSVGLQSKAEVSFSGDRNDVDHVTLYENGLAAISLARSFSSPGGEQVLTFQVPTTAVFETLTVSGEGVAVEELRSALSSKPVLEP